jgi:Na+-driven multidrug efflux pump
VILLKYKILLAIERLKNYLSSDVISFPLLKRILLPIFWEQFFLAFLALFSLWLLSFDGAASMSVVNMMTVINRVFTSLCLGMVTGGTVLVAQNIGANRVSDAGRCMIQTISTAVLLTAALGAILLLVRNPLIGYLLFGAGEEIISQAVIYFIGFSVSFPLFAFYQAFAGAMRGWGRSALAWRITLFVNLTEITLISVFLLGMGMGVFGITLAMVSARFLGACFAAFIMMRHRKELDLKLRAYLSPNPFILKCMVLIALPLALEQFFFNSGKAVAQRFVAAHGVEHMAAHGVINAVFNIFNLPQITLREALVTIVGMCIGCGRYDLARRYVYRFMRVIRMLLIYLLPVTIPLAAALIASYRLSHESNMLAAISLTLIFLSGPLLLAGSLSIPAALRAGGDAAFVSGSVLACMWGVRVGLSWLFAGVLGFGVVGLNLAMICDWLVRNLVFRFRLKGKAWFSRRLIAKSAV